MRLPRRPPRAGIRSREEANPVVHVLNSSAIRPGNPTLHTPAAERRRADLIVDGARFSYSGKNRYRSTVVLLNARRGSEQCHPMNSSMA